MRSGGFMEPHAVMPKIYAPVALLQVAKKIDSRRRHFTKVSENPDG
jgi:hypothetical protein